MRNHGVWTVTSVETKNIKDSTAIYSESVKNNNKKTVVRKSVKYFNSKTRELYPDDTSSTHLSPGLTGTTNFMTFRCDFSLITSSVTTSGLRKVQNFVKFRICTHTSTDGQQHPTLLGATCCGCLKNAR